MNNCRFCSIEIIKSNPKINSLTSQLIQYCYNEGFYFYFIKGINDILEDKLISDTVAFRYLESDDVYDRGYLQKRYRGDRVKNKLRASIKKQKNDPWNLNFCHLNVWKIFQDRERYLFRLMRVERSMEKNRGKLQRQPLRKNMILRSLEKDIQGDSFETKLHDIYDPQFSSMDSDSSEVHFALKNQETITKSNHSSSFQLKSLLNSDMTEVSEPFTTRYSSIPPMNNENNIFVTERADLFQEEKQKLTLTQKLEGIMNSLNERSTQDLIKFKLKNSKEKERVKVNQKIHKNFFFKKTPERNYDINEPGMSRKMLKKFILSELSSKSKKYEDEERKKNSKNRGNKTMKVKHEPILVEGNKNASLLGEKKREFSMSDHEKLFSKKIHANYETMIYPEEEITSRRMTKSKNLKELIQGLKIEPAKPIFQNNTSKSVKSVQKSKAIIKKSIKIYETKQNYSPKLHLSKKKNYRSKLRIKPSSIITSNQGFKYIRRTKSPSMAETKQSSILKTNFGMKSKSKSREKSRLSQNISVNKKSPLLKRDFKVLFSVSPQKKFSFSNLKNSLKYSVNFRKLSTISKNKSFVNTKKDKNKVKKLGSDKSLSRRNFHPKKSSKKFFNSLAKSWDPKSKKKSREKKKSPGMTASNRKKMKNLRSISQKQLPAELRISNRKKMKFIKVKNKKQHAQNLKVIKETGRVFQNSLLGKVNKKAKSHSRKKTGIVFKKSRSKSKSKAKIWLSNDNLKIFKTLDAYSPKGISTKKYSIKEDLRNFMTEKKAFKNKKGKENLRTSNKKLKKNISNFKNTRKFEKVKKYLVSSNVGRSKKRKKKKQRSQDIKGRKTMKDFMKKLI